MGAVDGGAGCLQLPHLGRIKAAKVLVGVFSFLPVVFDGGVCTYNWLVSREL